MYAIVRQQMLRAGSLMRTSAAYLHTSTAARELSKFTMPAMSPTMQDGGIAAWRKKEGESFNGGDVLLEIVSRKQVERYGVMLTWVLVCRKQTRRRWKWKHRTTVCWPKLLYVCDETEHGRGSTRP